MRRRGNKSNKVPGVKLRPADPNAIKSRSATLLEESEEWLAPETQPTNEYSTANYNTPHPFEGVLICATGVPDKKTLLSQTVALGAAWTPAFTDRVTHLVAVEHGGAKYNCALERRIPIMRPSWISDNHAAWLRGDDVDLESSMEGHRLPIFLGVAVCPSGIDMAQRTRIHEAVTRHEGVYYNKLERPVRVTHLLCSGEERTDKIKYAEKFNTTGEASIHIVWEEWFWDCLTFGGRFDESAYSIRNPRPERRASPKATPPPLSSQPSSQYDASSSQPTRSSSIKQPLAQSGGDEQEDEPAFTKVLPNVTLQLWSSLLSRRGYEVVDGEVILSPSKMKALSRPSDEPPSPTPAHTDPGLKHSVISTFRRANSFAPAVLSKDDDKSMVPAPFRRVASSTGVGGRPGCGNANAIASSSKVVPVPSNSGMEATAAPGPMSVEGSVPQIFSGMTLRPMGEAKSAAVKAAIEARGGRIIVDEDEYVDFVIVRLVSGSKIYRAEGDEAMRAKYRTECWLEQCIYQDKICPVEGHVTFIPLSIDIPIAGTEKIHLTISGFDESESCGIKRLLRALGIALAPTFSRKSSHLLCPSGTGPKFDKAQEWGIPVVNMAWLSHIATEGRVPQSLAQYTVLGPPGPNANTNKALPVVDVKGKGRASSTDIEMGDPNEEPGTRINDITNTSPPDEHANPLNALSKSDKPTTTRPTLQINPLAPQRQSTVIIPTSANPKTPSKSKRAIPQSDTLISTESMDREESYRPALYPHNPSSIATLSPETSRVMSPQIASFHGTKSSDSLSTLPSLVFNKETLAANANAPGSMFIPDPTSALQTSTRALLDVTSVPDDDDCIPSSKSPSPMKGFPLQGQGSSGSAGGMHRSSSSSSIVFGASGRLHSPVKISSEATKALKDSITTLLGKRPAGLEEEAGDGGSLEVLPSAAGSGGRAKRARPQRSKKNLCSDDSEQTLSTIPSGRVTRSGRGESSTLDNSEPPLSQRPQEESQEIRDESMRVAYQDPHQRDERNKLMRLFKGAGSAPVEESQQSVVSAGGTRRRSRRSKA